MKHRVKITELLSCTVEVEAIDKEDAIAIAESKYYNQDIVLDAENHTETRFELEEQQ